MKRLLKLLLLLELTYLVVVNAALQLPFTQDLVNRIRPDKFHLEWQQAWSWYPFRLHALGVSGNGQTRRQQWQFQATRVSGSIAIPSLLLKRVSLSGVRGQDIDYRQRPRLKPGIDYQHLLPLFPSIEGRDISPVDETPYRSQRPWRIAIQDLQITGTHKLWIYQARGKVSGRVAGELLSETRRGLLSLDLKQLDLEFKGVSFSDAYPVFERGSVRGSLGFAPFVRRDHQGLAMLQFLKADLTLDINPLNLAFINFFTLNLDGVNVGGQGGVSGRLRFDQGQVLAATDMHVKAPDLNVTLAGHVVEGEGIVDLSMAPTTDKQLDLRFNFGNLQVRHQDNPAVLLEGKELALHIGGDGRVLPQPGELNPTRSLAVEVNDLRVTDLALLQRYLPERWPVELRGGEGRLHGRASLAPTALDLDLSLTSKGTQFSLGDFDFETLVDSRVKLFNPQLMRHPTSVTGSYLRLQAINMHTKTATSSVPWQAHFDIVDGNLGLLPPRRKQAERVGVDLLKLIADSEAHQLLADAYGDFQLQAGVSDLAWLGLFLPDNMNTQVSGKGGLQGRVLLKDGMPAPGTELLVSSPDLGFEFLDYRARGDGQVRLAVNAGGTTPDWSVDIDLLNGRLRRNGDQSDTLHDVLLGAKARVKGVSLRRPTSSSQTSLKQESPAGRDMALQLFIERARLQDMSVFNRYIPAETRLRFIDGGADIRADVQLWRDDAKGWLQLDADAIQVRLDQQQLEGNLLADIKLVGGQPAQMRFDISSSRLLLDGVQVVGKKSQFDNRAWSAELQMQRAKTRWQVPLQLDTEAALRVSDSRPFVAVFNNQGWRPKFLSRMLTVEDIVGKAVLTFADGRLLIPEARISSDHIEVAARGAFGNDQRRGMIYLRYKKQDALLKIDGDHRNLDVIGVEKKFTAYRAGEIP